MKRNRKKQKRRAKTKRKLRGRNSGRRVSQPSAKSRVIRNSNPLKQINIKHREYFLDVDAYNEQNYLTILEVNPGLATVFPWLSGIAKNFEKYRFNSLSFEYIPAVGTSTAGSAAIAPDYDAADDNTTISKDRLLAFEDSVRGPLWSGFTMKCSPHNLRKVLYVRRDDLAINLDIKTYDNLQLILSRSAAADNPEVGELWVTYDITLITPQMDPDPDYSAYWSNQAYRASTTTDPYSETSEYYDTINLVETGEAGNGHISVNKSGNYLVKLITNTSGAYQDAVSSISMVPKVVSYLQSYWTTINSFISVAGDFMCYIGLWECPAIGQNRAPTELFAVDTGLQLTAPGDRHDWDLTVDKLANDAELLSSLKKLGKLYMEKQKIKQKEVVTKDEEEQDSENVENIGQNQPMVEKTFELANSETLKEYFRLKGQLGV